MSHPLPMGCLYCRYCLNINGSGDYIKCALLLTYIDNTGMPNNLARCKEDSHTTQNMPPPTSLTRKSTMVGQATICRTYDKHTTQGRRQRLRK